MESSLPISGGVPVQILTSEICIPIPEALLNHMHNQCDHWYAYPADLVGLVAMAARECTETLSQQMPLDLTCREASPVNISES